MSVRPPVRSGGPARPRSRARQAGRRRLLALSGLVLFAIVLAAQLASGGGSSRSPSIRPLARAAGGHTAAQGTVGEPHVSIVQTGALPAPVQDAAAVATTPSNFLLIGGINQAGASTADILRVSVNGATRMGSLAAPLHDATASLLAQSAYLLGGGVIASYPSIVRIDPASGTTALAGRLPTPASDLASAAIGSTIYLVGGYTGTTPLSSILAWQPGKPAQLVATLPKPLRYAAVAALSGQLIIVGGSSGEAASSDVYRFDPATRSLAHIAQLPEPLTHAAAAALGSTVLVFGGRHASASSQTDAVLTIDPSGAVRVAGRLPEPLSDLAAVALGQHIVLAGGLNRAGRLSDAILSVTLS